MFANLTCVASDVMLFEQPDCLCDSVATDSCSTHIIFGGYVTMPTVRACMRTLVFASQAVIGVQLETESHTAIRLPLSSSDSPLFIPI